MLPVESVDCFSSLSDDDGNEVADLSFKDEEELSNLSKSPLFLSEWKPEPTLGDNGLSLLGQKTSISDRRSWSKIL